MPEVVWQLETHQVVLKHEQVKSKVLDPIIDIPGMAYTILNQMFLLNQKLVALDRASGHKQNVSVLDVVRILHQKLVNDHLHRFKLWSDDVDLGAGFTAEVGPLQLELICEHAVFLDTHRLLVGLWVQEIHDYRVKGWLHNQVA